jgi:hypothetical protein
MFTSDELSLFLCFFYLSDLLAAALFILLLLLLLLKGGMDFVLLKNTELIERVYDRCGYAMQGPGKRSSSVASTSRSIPTLFKVRSKTRSSFPPFFHLTNMMLLLCFFLGFREIVALYKTVARPFFFFLLAIYI